MKTVGVLLKEGREESGLSVEQIADQTKIKEKFLIALEEGHWSTLPNLPIAAGFVRSYAQAIGLEPKHAIALLRRDFPASGGSKLAGNEIFLSRRFVWTPRTTLAISLLLTLLAVGGYLLRQYILFVAPPSLNVKTTQSQERLLVSGKTSPTATVEVNHKPVLLEKDGSFSLELSKEDIGDRIEVKATSRSGKSTVIQKSVN